MLLADFMPQGTSKPFETDADVVSDRLIIREFVLDDISALQEIDTNIFFVHLRQTYGGPMGFLNAALSHQKQKDRKDFYLAVVDRKTSQVIGSIMVYDYNKQKRQAEIGYFIDKRNQNCKIGTEACAYVMQRFGAFLNLKTFYATVHPENLYSKKLLSKLGFVQKGDVFTSKYKGDPDRSESYDQAGHLINTPRLGLFVSYDDFLSRKKTLLSGSTRV